MKRHQFAIALVVVLVLGGIGQVTAQTNIGTVTTIQGTAAGLSGAWPVKISDGTNSAILGADNADAVAVSGTGLSRQAAEPFVYNGTGWDRLRGNVDNIAVLATGTALTTTTNGADQTNYNFAGILIVANVTAVSGTTPSLTVSVQFKDPVNNVYVTPPEGAIATAAITATGTYSLKLYPGGPSVANASFNAALPRTWRLVYTISGTSPSFTLGVGASYIL